MPSRLSFDDAWSPRRLRFRPKRGPHSEPARGCSVSPSALWSLGSNGLSADARKQRAILRSQIFSKTIGYAWWWKQWRARLSLAPIASQARKNREFSHFSALSSSQEGQNIASFPYLDLIIPCKENREICGPSREFFRDFRDFILEEQRTIPTSFARMSTSARYFVRAIPTPKCRSPTSGLKRRTLNFATPSHLVVATHSPHPRGDDIPPDLR
jgi:hypothetical protein